MYLSCGIEVTRESGRQYGQRLKRHYQVTARGGDSMLDGEDVVARMVYAVYVCTKGLPGPKPHCNMRHGIHDSKTN